MGLMRKYFSNTAKPVGFLGKMMLFGMNMGHAGVSRWGLQQLPELAAQHVLDVGCGGGANVKRLGKKYKAAVVTGMDYAPLSVEQTKKKNESAISRGMCRAVQGDVSDMLFAREYYDLVTAFETVYFWPGPVKSFKEVYRVMKHGGLFLLVNESDGSNEKDNRWVDIIDGMQMYEPRQLQAFLEEAGFTEVEIRREESKNWVCLLARKA